MGKALKAIRAAYYEARTPATIRNCHPGKVCLSSCEAFILRTGPAASQTSRSAGDERAPRIEQSGISSTPTLCDHAAVPIPSSLRYSVELDRFPALGAFDFHAPRAFVALEYRHNDIRAPEIRPRPPDIHPSLGVHGPGPTGGHDHTVLDRPASGAVWCVTTRISPEFNSPRAIEPASPFLRPDCRRCQPERKTGSPQRMTFCHQHIDLLLYPSPRPLIRNRRYPSSSNASCARRAFPSTELSYFRRGGDGAGHHRVFLVGFVLVNFRGAGRCAFGTADRQPRL